jgi:hypothetical protein
MNITIHKDPFEYIVIDNFYTEEELKLIWQEFTFLLHDDKLFSGALAGSPLVNGKSLRNGNGIYLDTAYTYRQISNILKVNRKMFDKELTAELAKTTLIGKYLRYSLVDNTLLSAYRSGGYYKPHRDNTTLTAISWHHKTPKCYTGGDLYFPEYNVQVEHKDNTLIIFPGPILHGVTDIVSQSESLLDNRISLVTGICQSMSNEFHEQNDY